MHKIMRFIAAFLCLLIIAGGVLAVCLKNNASASENSLTVLSLWQIDSFEGGKGSRADYLKELADEFSEQNNVFIKINAVSADAARQNIENGSVPDIISYGSGFYGIESLVSAENYYSVWCRGAYCLLTLGNSDFSDVNEQNTIINAGKDNLVSAAALFCGISGAQQVAATGAYVKLINGDCKYLLGTQRDVVRLQTRGVQFSVKAVTQFNDLYQNISVLTKDAQKQTLCKSFIDYVLSQSERLEKISMLCDGLKLYEGQLGELENISFEYRMPSIISQEAAEKIKNAAQSGDIKLLKSLLK